MIAVSMIYNRLWSSRRISSPTKVKDASSNIDYSRVPFRARRGFSCVKNITIIIAEGARARQISMKIDEHKKLKSGNAEPYAR